MPDGRRGPLTYSAPPCSYAGAVSFGARVVFVLACAPVGAVVFGASWVLIGIIYDALANIHPHQVVPTAAVTGILGLPVGALAAIPAAIAGSRRQARDLRTTAWWLAVVWVVATVTVVAWLAS